MNKYLRFLSWIYNSNSSVCLVDSIYLNHLTLGVGSKLEISWIWLRNSFWVLDSFNFYKSLKAKIHHNKFWHWRVGNWQFIILGLDFVASTYWPWEFWWTEFFTSSIIHFGRYFRFWIEMDCICNVCTMSIAYTIP